MNRTDIMAAAELFANARRTGTKRAPLPAQLQPASIDDGHAIQDATVALLGETIGGWKTGFDKTGAMSRAPIFKRLIHTTPARMTASNTLLRGIEAEIAFRFVKDLPARDSDYSRSELEQAVEAFAAIELLDSRYAENGPRSTLEKLADCIVQGGIVCGPPHADWRSIDFAKLGVVLSVDGKEIARNTGSHPTGDPIAPLLALANALRKTSGISAGQIVTTGTWTGVNFVGADSLAIAQFDGFAPVSVQYTP